MSRKLKGRSIVVIGASGGIGRELSGLFHEEGARVWLVARGQDKLRALWNELGGGARAIVWPADATDPAAMEGLFQAVRPAEEKIDLVVIAAGTHRASGIDMSAESAREMSDLLYRSIYLPTRVAGHVAQRHLRLQAGSPWLVNFSSHAAIKFDLPNNNDYSPMKAAALAYIKNLASELKNTDIRLTDIQPATVNTPDNREWILSRGLEPEDMIQPTEMARWIVENIDNPDVPLEKVFDNGRVL